MLTQNLPEFWEKMYNSNKDDWDLKAPTPALLEFFDSADCPKEGRVLVPGAGRGYDAEAWAVRGHETVAVDFCATAVDSLDGLSRKQKNLTAVDLDIFELDPKNYGQFDIIWEYTCFSAIHPGRRDEYFEVWYKMLKDDGLIVSFFFPISGGNTMEGPPHSTTEGELMARMDGIFNIEKKIIPTNSVKGRAGKEQIWLLRKEL